MKKIKEFYIFITSIISLIFIFLFLNKEKNSDSFTEKENKSKELEKDSKKLSDTAANLHKQAESLDNPELKEDEEWYKKR